MATNAQDSGPLFDEIFTDDQWDANHADGMGIIGDTDGSAFGLTLPAVGNTAEIGSATVESRAVVAGRGAYIPKGLTQSLDIPASTGGTAGRTDLIVERCDLDTFTTAPGPVRLYRIPGTEGSTAVPSHNSRIDLPLYAVRRKQGEGLNQTIVTDLRHWMGRSILVAPTGALPLGAPLGTRATRGDVDYAREMSSGGSPSWVEKWRGRELRTGIDVVSSGGEGFPRMPESRLVRKGTYRHFYYVVRKSPPFRNPNPIRHGALWVGTLWDGDRPIGRDQFPLTGWALDVENKWRAAAGFIAPSGQIFWSWASTNNDFGSTNTERQTLILTGTWEVA